MSPDVALWAILSAFCYAAGAVLQQREAASCDPGLPLLSSLARRPLWVAGLVVNAAGLACQALALRHGQLVVVQPLLVLSIVFSAVLAARVREQRVESREWGGMAAVSGGLLVFLAAARPESGLVVVSACEWLQALALSLGVAGLCAVAARGRVRASLLGVCAGILFGAAATVTKATVDVLSGGVGAALTSWPLYAMAFTTALAFYATQKAFQAGPLVASFPALIATDPVTAALLGAWLYGERPQGGLASTVLATVGAVAILVGLRVLSESSLLMDEGMQASGSFSAETGKGAGPV